MPYKLIRSKVRSICSPLLEESEAALFGLQATIVMGAKKVIVKGNTKIVIEVLKDLLEESLNEIRNCIVEQKEFLQNFDSFIIQHACRSRNNMAHLVAKSKLKNNSLNIALGIISNEIQSVIDKKTPICTNNEV